MNKPGVTIAIPAHNEEKTILGVIRDLYEQSSESYHLINLAVYSDGSTDRTVPLIKDNFPQVQVFDFKVNKGKQFRINQILSEFSTDIFILVDADITILNQDVLDQLVSNFSDNRVGVVCAHHLALEPNTYLGHAAYFGYKVWNTARNILGERGIRYFCEGGTIALSNRFAKNFRLPVNGNIGDDSYCFYYAIKHGFDVKLAENARIYFGMADNYRDYLRQMRRFLADHNALKQYFNQELIDQYESITLVIAVRALLQETIKAPLQALAYLILQLSVKIQMPFYKAKAGWLHIRRN